MTWWPFKLFLFIPLCSDQVSKYLQKNGAKVYVEMIGLGETLTNYNSISSQDWIVIWNYPRLGYI